MATRSKAVDNLNPFDDGAMKLLEKAENRIAKVRDCHRGRTCSEQGRKDGEDGNKGNRALERNYRNKYSNLSCIICFFSSQREKEDMEERV